MLEFCDVLDSADQLVVLKRKKNIHDEELNAFFKRYCNLPNDITLRLKVLSKLGIKV